MRALLMKLLKNSRKSLAILLVVNTLFLTMYISMYPAMLEQSEQLEQLISAYPPEFMAVFGIEGDFFSTLEIFVGAEHYSLMWIIMLVILVAGLGGSAIAEEVEKGTMAFLLSQPISRTKLYLTKYISGTIITSIFVIVSILITLPIAALFSVEVDITGHLYLVVLGLLFGFALYGVSIMVSSFLSSKILVGALIGGITIFMYVFVIFARLNDSYENLQYLSFFHYFDYSSALTNHTIYWESAIVFVVCGVTAAIIGLIKLRLRDLHV